MSLPFVLDEHVPRALWKAVQQHNALGVNPLDVVEVGIPNDLPKGTPDPQLLLWAEREGRILVSRDRKTLPGHLAAHLTAGHRCAGIILVRRSATVPQIISFLEAVAYATDATYWRDRLESIP